MIRIKTQYYEANHGPNRSFETSIENFLSCNVVKPEVEKQIRELEPNCELLIRAQYGLFFMERIYEQDNKQPECSDDTQTQTDP